MVRREQPSTECVKNKRNFHLFQEKGYTCSPLLINIEIVETITFLGTLIPEDLKWDENISSQKSLPKTLFKAVKQIWNEGRYLTAFL